METIETIETIAENELSKKDQEKKRQRRNHYLRKLKNISDPKIRKKYLWLSENWPYLLCDTCNKPFKPEGKRASYCPDCKLEAQKLVDLKKRLKKKGELDSVATLTEAFERQQREKELTQIKKKIEKLDVRNKIDPFFLSRGDSVKNLGLGYDVFSVNY